MISSDFIDLIYKESVVQDDFSSPFLVLKLYNSHKNPSYVSKLWLHFAIIPYVFAYVCAEVFDVLYKLIFWLVPQKYQYHSISWKKPFIPRGISSLHGSQTLQIWV